MTPDRETWRVIEGDAAGLLRRGDYADYMDFGRDPATQARSREIEAFTSRIDQAYPGGLDGYIQDRAEAVVAAQEGGVRLINLLKQRERLLTPGQGGTVNRDNLEKIEGRIDTAIKAALEQSLEAKTSLRSPHPDQDWTLADRFQRAEAALWKQRSMKEGVAAGTVTLATVPVSTATSTVLGTLAGIGSAGAAASRDELKSIFAKNNIDFADPMEARNLINTHVDDIALADAKALKAAATELIGLGAGKFVGRLLRSVLDGSARSLVEEGVSRGVGIFGTEIADDDR